MASGTGGFFHEFTKVSEYCRSTGFFHIWSTEDVMSHDSYREREQLVPREGCNTEVIINAVVSVDSAAGAIFMVNPLTIKKKNTLWAYFAPSELFIWAFLQLITCEKSLLAPVQTSKKLLAQHQNHLHGPAHGGVFRPLKWVIH